MHFKLSSVKWKPFCLGLNVLIKNIESRKCYLVWLQISTKCQPFYVQFSRQCFNTFHTKYGSYGTSRYLSRLLMTWLLVPQRKIDHYMGQVTKLWLSCYSQVPNRRVGQNIRSGWYISSKWYKGRAVYKVRVTRCSASPNIRSGLQIIFGLIFLQKQQFSIKIGFHHAVCE